jgi:3-isopropylmalate/(R)-2-methylmalate dehydratase large subunit
LVHEVTSPQAYEGLRLAGRKVWRTSSVVATADHNTPTTGWAQGYDGIADPISKLQITTLDANIKAHGAAAYFPFLDKRQGIVHVIGPENGATLPGMTVVCGDSHTSTHARSARWRSASAPARSSTCWPPDAAGQEDEELLAQVDAARRRGCSARTSCSRSSAASARPAAPVTPSSSAAGDSGAVDGRAHDGATWRSRRGARGLEVASTRRRSTT